jgi:hypothetical protein
MAQVATLAGPRDIAVVAGAAMLTVDDAEHGDVIAAGFGNKTKIAMADLTAVPDAVEPMWEDDGGRAVGVAAAIHDHIAVLRACDRGSRQRNSSGGDDGQEGKVSTYWSFQLVHDPEVFPFSHCRALMGTNYKGANTAETPQCAASP